MIKASEKKDEIELDALAEQELVRLQQHYRIMESTQGSISDRDKLLLNKQRNLINTLLEEKKETLVKLNIAGCRQYGLKDEEDNARLAQLMEIQQKCSEYIRTEKAQLKELDTQITKLQKELMKLRASRENDANVTSKAAAKDRNIRILEGRLYNESVKFNQQVSLNADLRREIDHLLKERARFNLLYQALIVKLNHNKKIMMDLVEQATHAYDQREESQNKLALLREKGRVDLVTQSAEMRELKRRFDHDSKLQEFLSIKGQRRLMVDLEQKDAARKRLHREATERQLQHYKDTLDKICEFTGETDIDRLSAQFIKQEEENFALFNYVYELNNELEVLHEQVVELRLSIDEQTGLSRQREQQQQGRLQALREDLRKAEEDASDSVHQLSEWTSLREKLLKGIEHLFNIIKCDKSPLLELLGGNHNVTPYNMMLFLGIVEKRCTELISRCAGLERSAKKHNKPLPFGEPIVSHAELPTTETPPGIDEMVPKQPCPLCVEQEEVSASGDSIVAPMTRKEVREALMTKMLTPGMSIHERVHNISACRLPRSRRIMQRRKMEQA